jgi:hypothetical protein
MPRCKNPECMKEIPEGRICCNEKCMRQYLALKKMTRKELKFVSEEDIWLGQERRKRAMETIQKLARESCPIPYKKFACLVSLRTGLSLRKVTDDYLEILLELGLLKRNDNILTFKEAEP